MSPDPSSSCEGCGSPDYEETATCFLCNIYMPPKSRVYFIYMVEERMESVIEILAEKFSDEQIVEALGKEPVACTGK